MAEAFGRYNYTLPTRGSDYTNEVERQLQTGLAGLSGLQTERRRAAALNSPAVLQALEQLFGQQAAPMPDNGMGGLSGFSPEAFGQELEAEAPLAPGAAPGPSQALLDALDAVGVEPGTVAPGSQMDAEGRPIIEIDLPDAPAPVAQRVAAPMPAPRPPPMSAFQAPASQEELQLLMQLAPFVQRTREQQAATAREDMRERGRMQRAQVRAQLETRKQNMRQKMFDLQLELSKQRLKAAQGNVAARKEYMGGLQKLANMQRQYASTLQGHVARLRASGLPEDDALASQYLLEANDAAQAFQALMGQYGTEVGGAETAATQGAQAPTATERRRPGPQPSPQAGTRPKPISQMTDAELEALAGGR